MTLEWKNHAVERDNVTDLWTGQFGNEYTARNLPTDAHIKSRAVMWTHILSHMGALPVKFLECGAGSGVNLRALRSVYAANGALTGDLCLAAVEANREAFNHMLPHSDAALHGTIADLDFLKDGCVDVAFTYGVLIHIPPEARPTAMRQIHRCSSRWIVAAEYFNDRPISIPYRGQANALFKADFGSEYLALFPDLRCRAYAFMWKPLTGLDNVTWWLFEKDQGS